MSVFARLRPGVLLPRDEILGGYIFFCNNDRMQVCLLQNIFGMSDLFRDSVRAIRPGIPLFLYNYQTRFLYGIFEATSFGGINIEPEVMAGYPAQVRVRWRRQRPSLSEEIFAPLLHLLPEHGFRIELTVPETLSLMDAFDRYGGAF